MLCFEAVMVFIFGMSRVHLAWLLQADFEVFNPSW